MDLKRLQRAADDAANYPAAHSMDSGWFAVDDDGHVAHFDTGEGGAMPAAAELVTGEASGEDGWAFVMAWLARQRGASIEGLDLTVPFSAAFESNATAEAAVTQYAEGRRDSKSRVVEFFHDGIDGSLHASVSEMPGFIGFAPTHEDIFEDETLSERYPIIFYAHGSWEIPGEYVRRSGKLMSKPVSDPELRERAEHMATSFPTQETIQLADFYENAECHSWSEADLRTGDVDEEAGRGRSGSGRSTSPLKSIVLLVAALLFLWFVLRLTN